MHLRRDGQSLVEVIIVLALFLLISVGVIGALSSSLGASKRGSDHVAAAGYMKEAVEAVRSIRDRDWNQVTAGTYGLDTGSGYYEFQGSGDVLGPDNGFTRTITIEDVSRSPGLQGDISLTGINDSNTKKVTIDIAWEVFAGQTQSITHGFYVYNYSGPGQSWIQTTQADFNAGFENSTDTDASVDGEVLLRNRNEAWDGLVAQHEIDLDGLSDRVAVEYDQAQDIVYTLSANTSGNEFIALDVENVSAATPQILRGFDLGGADGYDFVIKDGYGYIATSGDASEIVVVDLASMTQVNSIEITGSNEAISVAISGNELLVGRVNDPNQEFIVYDISNPTGTITQLGATEIGVDVNAIVANEDYAFLATGNGSAEIFVIDLTGYGVLQQLDLDGSGPALSLDIVDQNLYVGKDSGGGGFGFGQIDISSPSTGVSVTNTLSLSANANGLDVAIDSQETFAALATDNNSSEVTVVDLATFSELRNGDVDGNEIGYAVDIFGGVIYVGNSSDTADLTTFFTGAPTWTANLVGSANKSRNHTPTAIYVQGDYTYLATENSNQDDELFIYDTSDTSNPTLLGSFDVGSGINDMIVDGDYAYLATGDNDRELDVIDVSNKANPVRVGSYDAPRGEDGFSLELNGTTLYLGLNIGGGASVDKLHILDVSDPTSPALIGAGASEVALVGLALYGDYIFGANEHIPDSELYIYDVSDPTNPTEIDVYDITGTVRPTEIDVYGDNLAISRDSGGGDEVVILDISTPTTPSVIGGVPVGSIVNGIDLTDAPIFFLATAERDQEFQRWDAQIPNAPTLTSTFDLGGDGSDVMKQGDCIYVATDNNTAELQIICEGPSPNEYSPIGTFTSQPFDSGAVGTAWSGIDWTSSGTGSVEFRTRTADTESNLGNAIWVGPDGTSATTYDTVGQAIATNPNATGTRWIQWKVYVSGTASSTPVLEDVTVSY